MGSRAVKLAGPALDAENRSASFRPEDCFFLPKISATIPTVYAPAIVWGDANTTTTNKQTKTVINFSVVSCVVQCLGS